MAEPYVSHVSDTAKWAAYYRALETQRSDALFKDEFAQRLAGERGAAIAQNVRAVGLDTGWPIVTRTQLIDQLVLQSIDEGCDAVLNLAAGLDARPFRLALPAALEWIEVDLPGLLEEKERLLGNAQPHCHRRVVSLDLADLPSRRALFAEVGRAHQKVLVLSEGLLIYLGDAAVETLCADLRAVPQMHAWIVDFSSPAVLQNMQKTTQGQMGQATFKFGPPDGVGFFEKRGWKATEVRSIFKEAVKLRRVPFPLRLLAIFPDPNPRHLKNGRWSTVSRFVRA